MERANPNFRHQMHLEAPDFEATGMSELLVHPILIVIEDNGDGGVLHGAPIAITFEIHLEDYVPNATTVSLTMEELIELRDTLNEAIVYAERL